MKKKNYLEEIGDYMKRKCINCGENVDQESTTCPSCGETTPRVNQLDTHYPLLSTISLVIGCFEIGLFSWFVIFFDSFHPWFGGLLGWIIFNSVFLFFVVVGVILGAMSVKKGRRKRAIIGLVFNSIGVILHTYGTIFFIVILSDPYINL